MNSGQDTPYSLERMISIALDLSAEKDFDRLMKKILSEVMDTCNCDAGTIYLLEGNLLHFYTSFTKSKGITPGNAKKLNLPPVPLTRSHVCACSAMDHRIINIADIYESEEYDFSGAQKYDELNDYRTGSMLVIPMSDEKDEIVGVLQLINALDGDGNIIPFRNEYEEIIKALASLAGISINNHVLAQEINDLLHSFVRVMVGAIETRTPYNASHTRNMVRYGRHFIDWLKTSGNDWEFNDDRRDAFLMSVWLHDIGKLLVPLNVLDKPDRLAGIGERIKNRIDTGCLMERIRSLEEPSRKTECDAKAAKLQEAWKAIQDANIQGFLDDYTIAGLEEYSRLTCLDAEGREVPLLTDDELRSITVRKGTLTDEEKAQVEMHVVHTVKMLEGMNFKGIYKDVPHLAGSHHEFVDGSGYPDHLSGSELSDEIRLITVLDIYDALTAEDRPYKPPIEPKKAFGILYSMCDEGKLDRRIVSLFEESRAWCADD